MPTLNASTSTEDVPLGPALSIYDPVYIGIDEFGHSVRVPMIYRGKLLGGEPGAGKSSELNLIVAHAALSLDCRLCLLDGKQVELGQWAYLRAEGLRKIVRGDGITAILLAVDEIAYYSATVGDKKTQEQFSALLRDLVARGRAVGIIVVAATQRPSSDIIPTSLRDLFAWRMAFRCTTDVSSDIVLGHGWAARGYSANTISPNNQGVGLLIAEGGVPQLVKAAYLSDRDCARLAGYAAALRTTAAWHRIGQPEAALLTPVPAAS
jgi:S-DNA-T family DNA segregation ATPase FtsK/SpoIIIE